MAFTALQCAKIRLYLGYPDLYRYENFRLEGILTGHQLSLETESLVIRSIDALDVVDAQITGVNLSLAGLKRADDIEFYQHLTSSETRSYGRLYVSRISISLGVPIYSDYFGSMGYAGDSYSTGGSFGNGSGGGNTIKLG